MKRNIGFSTSDIEHDVDVTPFAGAKCCLSVMGVPSRREEGDLPDALDLLLLLDQSLLGLMTELVHLGRQTERTLLLSLATLKNEHQ